MEFRILGPLEVVDDGRTVDVGQGKQRALLASLLLDANRVVSADRLIAALWGDTAPGTAPKALQVYVSGLRKALGRERILTRAPGYALRVEPGELDLDRFQELVSEGRRADALRLWRGSPLADFAYEAFAQPEIARLEELRLTCVEERIEGELSQGRHGALVGELDALVREHPLRERLRGQLMLALYRSGRQAEALDVYGRGRALLSDELGLEPSGELKELQRAILAHDPSLAAPAESLSVVPAEPASVLTETEGPAAPSPREVRKTVTVLVCDIAPTDTSLDPETLRRMVTRGLDELVPVLERHGARVERSIGGAVTAVFGIPVVHEDDPLRASRAAIEMAERLSSMRDELERQWGSWLELRAGIGTGEVLAGGDDDQVLATGPAVQSSLQMHQAAQSGEVLLDESTSRLVRDAMETEVVGGRVRLLGMREPASGHASRFDSPMVGRERERRRLHDAFEQAGADRSCQLFTILGAAGVGKSRLVQEFVDAVAGEALIGRGRCLPYGDGITYWPVLESVWELAGLEDTASAEENLAKLASLLEPRDDAAVVARRVGEVVGLSEEASGADETFSAARALFEALARSRPLVLVLDDIHWGEATFLDLVDHLADWIHDAPVLLVCIARPELLDGRPHWGGGKLNATSVLLEPLSEAESAELVDSLVGSGELDVAQRRRIVDAASGNPLFVEEMLALVLEGGGSEAIAVPPTIQALLATRLDRLPDGERTVVEAAAIEGKLFHGGSVAELTAIPQAELESRLLALTRKELIRPERPLFSGERGYRFRHILIRDAAYESIPKDARASLHERYGSWLERRLGERTLESDEIVGYHFEQAFRYRSELGRLDDDARGVGRRAAERLGAAGRRALLRSDASAGVNLISRGVALLAPDDPFRVELIPNVRVVQGVEELGWADRALTEAVEAAATSGNRALAAHALVQRGFLRLFTSDATPRELYDVADRAIAVFEAPGDELGLARAWRLVAQAHYLGQRAASSADALERALIHARRAGERFEEREIVEWLVIAYLLGPTPAVDAFARCTELLAQEWEDPLLPAEISGAAAALAAMKGELERAEELIERARTAMNDAGEWIWIVSFWYAYISTWKGEPEAAEEELRPAYAALKRVGETSHFSSIAHALSDAVYLQGRYAEAEELTGECERASRPNDVHSQILWRSIRAKALARRGEFESARAFAREAVEIAEASDFLLAHSDALADLAEVLLLAGRGDESEDAFQAALRCYGSKGNVLAAARARQLRAETQALR